MLPPRVFGEADEIGRELREAEFISLQALKAWTEGMEADELVELIREDREMHIYAKIYEFAASAGALEGYVYPKEQMKK